VPAARAATTAKILNLVGIVISLKHEERQSALSPGERCKCNRVPRVVEPYMRKYDVDGSNKAIFPKGKAPL
jgi:hypothetical protein